MIINFQHQHWRYIFSPKVKWQYGNRFDLVTFCYPIQLLSIEPVSCPLLSPVSTERGPEPGIHHPDLWAPPQSVLREGNVRPLAGVWDCVSYNIPTSHTAGETPTAYWWEGSWGGWGNIPYGYYAITPVTSDSVEEMLYKVKVCVKWNSICLFVASLTWCIILMNEKLQTWWLSVKYSLKSIVLLYLKDQLLAPWDMILKSQIHV